MMEKNQAVIEGILFAIGEPVPTGEIAGALGLSPDETETALEAL